MRTASNLTYLKGVLIRQLLRITTTARREHSRSSTACHSCFSTEGRAPGRPSQPEHSLWSPGYEGPITAAFPPRVHLAGKAVGQNAGPPCPAAPLSPFPASGSKQNSLNTLKCGQEGRKPTNALGDGKEVNTMFNYCTRFGEEQKTYQGEKDVYSNCKMYKHLQTLQSNSCPPQRTRGSGLLY